LDISLQASASGIGSVIQRACAFLISALISVSISFHLLLAKLENLLTLIQNRVDGSNIFASEF